MELNRFMLPLNVRAMVRDLGHLTQLFALLMAAPLAVSLFSREYARGRNAFQLYTSEFGEENLVGDVKATSRLVIKIYFLFTGAGFLVFVAAGMPPFDALLHVMSTVSTGGFSAYSNSLGQYQNAAIDVAASVFMLLGAVGFPAYYVLYRRGLRRAKPDPQVLCLAALVVIFFLLAAPILKVSGAGLTSAYFHVVSALTTTGFSITSASEWPDAFKWLTVFLMTVGGSAGSTAGGLKIFRLILLVQVVRWMILHTLLPKEAKIPVKVGRHSIRDHQIKTTKSCC